MLDANVLVSAVISAAGPPRETVNAWVDGRFELIASPALLEELCDVLDRPKFRRWVSTATAADFIGGLAQVAVVLDDPPAAPGLSPDPDDDSLIALACRRRRLPVSGDRHLLDLADPDPPVLTPRRFVACAPADAAARRSTSSLTARATTARRSSSPHPTPAAAAGGR